MKTRHVILGLAAVLLLACKPASGPIVDAEAGSAVAEAGVAVVNDACSLLEGVDSNGTLRTICATVEEIAQIVAYILTLRTAPDGGIAAASVGCSPLPGGSFCATSVERAKGILYITQLRESRLKKDGGAK